MARKRSAQPSALVSGQAGVAIFRDSRGYTCRRVGENFYHSCRPDDVPYLLGEATDVVTIIGKSAEQVVRILENESAQDLALHLMLIILDSEAHLRAKALAADAIEELIATATVQQFVLDRLYSRTLPGCADTADALRTCLEGSFKMTWALISELRADQTIVAAIRDQWDCLNDELFGGLSAKRLMERVAVEEGLFFKLCKHPEQVTDEALRQWAQDPRLKELPGLETLHLWTKPFQVVRKLSPAATQLELFPPVSARTNPARR